MRYRQRISDLLAQLETLKLELETLKKNLKKKGITFKKNTEYNTLWQSIYRCKKKIQVEEAYLSGFYSDLERESFLSIVFRVHKKGETAGFVNVHAQELRLLEDALLYRWRYLKEVGLSFRDSKVYQRISNSMERIKSDIRRLKLRSLEDELIFLRLSSKDRGVLVGDSKDYHRVSKHIRRLKQRIDPLFYYQKSLKKLVIKQRKLEFQLEMLKQTLKKEGILTRHSKEYQKLLRSISRCKKKIAFENSKSIYEIIFL